MILSTMNKIFKCALLTFLSGTFCVLAVNGWAAAEATDKIPPKHRGMNILEEVLQQFVPEARMKLAEKGLTQAFGTLDIESVSPVYDAGYSKSTMFHLRINGIDAFLRFNNLDEENYQIREHEVEVMSIESRRGIVPTVYYANTKDGIMITRFVARKPMAKTMNLDGDTLQMLASTLRETHKGSPVRWNYNVFDDIHKLEEEVGKYYPDITKPVFAYIRGIEEVMAVHSFPQTLCHNDANPDNVMYDGHKIWMIDWDHSGMNDPYFDLATVANFYIFDAAKAKLFLEAYLGHAATPLEYAHFAVMREVSLAYYGVRFLKEAMGHNLRFHSPEQINAMPSLLEHFKTLDHAQPLLYLPVNEHKLALVMLKEMRRHISQEDFSSHLEILKSATSQSQ